MEQPTTNPPQNHPLIRLMAAMEMYRTTRPYCIHPSTRERVVSYEGGDEDTGTHAQSVVDAYRDLVDQIRHDILSSR